MKTDDIKSMAAAWAQVQEASKKKLDPVGQADADIDNDGDVDSSDKYLHNRRKAISKNMKKDEVEMNPKKKEDKADAAQPTEATQLESSARFKRAWTSYNYSLSAMNPRSHYKSTRYGNNDTSNRNRADAHFEAARAHEVKAKRYKKARNSAAADLHTSAAKAHQKASNGISRAIRLADHPDKLKIDGEILKHSKAAHAASMKAAAHRQVRKEQLESTIPPVYARIVEARGTADKDGKHYKKAADSEDWNEKEKNNKGAMDMRKDHEGPTIDNPEAGDQMTKAANAAPKAAMRKGDNAAGDKKIIPSATPTKGM